mgnify:CR=1 FL=1
MIIVKLIGGLGNQMFQYAFGRHLAYINNTELKLDIAGFTDYKLHNYSLNNYNIQENIATPEDIKYFKKYQRKPGRKWFLYNQLIANGHKYVQERQFHFNPQMLKMKNEVYLDGYWQSEKYFKDVEVIIRDELSVKNKLNGKNLEVSKKIDAVDSISIHIRRTDYVTDPVSNEYHGACNIEYYKKATNLIVDKIKAPYFFIFSDDREWAKENLKLSYPTYYVDHNDAQKNYEDLRLMSMCKHNIIANSSFSWWGAWLNQNKNKIVTGPKIWFRNAPKADTKDIFPEEWIKI